jgi:probable F420-dependent oxidoreductase
MRFGIHLPQFGRAAVAGAVEQGARLAEELGFDDVWVSDHLVVPEDQSYPSPYLYDPVVALTFAAASTSTIGLGTSVLVGPQYPSPLALANSLATLDNMSRGRLTVGIGIGWSAAEYEALHAPFDHRGARLDEIIDLFRTAWSEDPATHDGRYYPFTDIRVLPKPAHDVPIWVGGRSEGALRRATTKADGFHGVGVKPEDAQAVVERLRAARPDDGFTISLRVAWDAADTPADEIRAQCEAYDAAGVQHLMATPERGDLEARLASIRAIASALGLPRG